MWIASEKLDSFKVMVCIGQEGDWKTIRESGTTLQNGRYPMKRAICVISALLILVFFGCGDDSPETPIGPTEKLVKGLSGDTYMNTKYGIRITNLPVDEWTAEDLGADGQGMRLQSEQGFMPFYLLLLMEPVPAHQFVGPGEKGYLDPVAEANIPYIIVAVDYERGRTFETPDLSEELERYANLWFYEIESKKLVYVGTNAGVQAIMSRNGSKCAETWFAKGDLLVRCIYDASDDEFDKYLDVYMEMLENITLMGT